MYTSNLDEINEELKKILMRSGSNNQSENKAVSRVEMKKKDK